MTFNIRDHVSPDTKGRAICPACQASKGVGHNAKNLSIAESGAYQCFRGCTSEEIRAVLGASKDKVIPTATATASKKVTVSPQKIRETHDSLLQNMEAMDWLENRGIDRAAVVRHKLGLVRSKQGDQHVPAISIPIPADASGTQYYQKKRIKPWCAAADRPKSWSAWSQYGIPAMVWFTHKPADATETWLCEGEWDAIRLAMEMKDTSIAVACFTCGAGNIPADKELERLPGKITIFYDRDDAGTKGALKVQATLKERAYIATIPSSADHKPGYDLSDALKDGVTIETLKTLVAVPYAEPKRVNPLASRLKTNDEFMSEAQDYVEWLVPDLLTQDELFIIGMPPRGGKSLFGLTLAKAVAMGGTFLDRPTTQGSVIYINLEDSPTKIKHRQVAQNWSEGLPVYWMEKFKLSELDDLKDLADDIPDLRLVVLDTFSRVRDDNHKESSSELGRILEPLQEWAKERGICILITHHTSKTVAEHPNADPFDSLRGSTSIRATCRGAIVIVPVEGSYRLLAENGYVDQLDVNVRINPETLEWKLIGNWAPRVDGDMKTQIIDHLNLYGDATVATISKDLNFNGSSVSTIMSRLQREGFVSKIAGKGRSPGVYTRSSNLLKQLEVLFEHPNVDGVSDTALLKQNNLYGDSPAKVIIEGKSDHYTLDSAQENNHCASLDSDSTPMITFASDDHFLPTVPILFEQSHNVDGVSDVCSNSKNESLSKFEQTGTTTSEEEWGRLTTTGSIVRVVKRRGSFVWVRESGMRVTTKIASTELSPLDAL